MLSKNAATLDILNLLVSSRYCPVPRATVQFPPATVQFPRAIVQSFPLLHVFDFYILIFD